MKESLNYSVRLIYIKIATYLHLTSLIGVGYFLLNESIEHTLIYLSFCIFFYFLSFIVFYIINSIFIKLNFIFIYIGYLLTIPIVFYNSEKYRESGWDGIGLYKFDHSQTFNVLIVVSIYLFLFVIMALIFDKLLLKPYKKITLYKQKDYFLQLSFFSKYSFIFVTLLILQCFLSYVMFTYRIGVVGIIPEQGLQFRIAGILYYYRYFIIPIISFILLFSNHRKNNNIIIYLILIEVLVTGVFSVSRAIVVLHLIPLILFLIYKRKKLALIVVLIYSILTIYFVTLTRDFVFYLDNFHEVNLFKLFNFRLFFDHASFEKIIDIIFMLIVRIQGYQEFCAVFFNDMKYKNINLFLNSHLGFRFLDYGNFNVVKDIYKINLPKDKAFGMSLDPFGYLYLSAKSFLETLMLFLFWIVYLIMNEKIFNLAFKRFNSEFLFVIFLNFYFLLSYIHPSVKTIFFVLPVSLLFINMLSARIKFR